MKLLWTSTHSDDCGTAITAENAAKHTGAETEFGRFHLVTICNRRKCKDGLREFMVYIYVPGASSSEWITLIRKRGNLLDAINDAEYALFQRAGEFRKYRIPTECLDIDPAAKKLLDRNALCFECDSETCSLNPEGICLYPLLYGKVPEYDDHSGCKGFLCKEG